MRESEKELSMGEYLSYLSNENLDMFDETVRPRVATYPREWSECFLCYRDVRDDPHCFTDLDPMEFCRERVRVE